MHHNSTLADSMERFELKKMADTKQALHEYLYSEIAYHAKGKFLIFFSEHTEIQRCTALEIYTAMENHLQEIDLTEDLVHIQDKMRREPFQTK